MKIKEATNMFWSTLFLTGIVTSIKGIEAYALPPSNKIDENAISNYECCDQQLPTTTTLDDFSVVEPEVVLGLGIGQELDEALKTASEEEPKADPEPIVDTKSYSKDDVALLAHIINAENGIEFKDEDLTNRLQIYTGQVVLNRMNLHYMGATSIEEVLYTPGQYACISDCSWDNPVSERAYKNAELLLSGAPYWDIYGIEKMPDNVIYQAEFKQGTTWMKVHDTYFGYE